MTGGGKKTKDKTMNGVYWQPRLILKKIVNAVLVLHPLRNCGFAGHIKKHRRYPKWITKV
jgi:Fe-S oxidoreductase